MTVRAGGTILPTEQGLTKAPFGPAILRADQIALGPDKTEPDIPFVFSQFTGARSALDQKQCWFGFAIKITSKKLAPLIQSNTASNVKYNWFKICRAESCDQNEIEISKTESLLSLQ